MKKRLEHLLESALKYERGQFAHRIPPLGDDEIGRVAEHLNRMARRVEQQVASLQKLATEKARWREQMKQSVITEERQRLARELHDAVSQQLFAISMLLSAVREHLPADHPMHGRIVTAEKVAGEAQNEMRALLMQLRPVPLEGKGLKEGLKELLAELKAKQPLEIDWKWRSSRPAQGSKTCSGLCRSRCQCAPSFPRPLRSLRLTPRRARSISKSWTTASALT